MKNHVRKSKCLQDKMSAKESSIWLGVLDREEMTVHQLSSDNGMSEVTHHSGRGERREDSNSSSNEYDVHGFEDARGSASSKDDGRNPRSTSTEGENCPIENAKQPVQGKEQVGEQPKRKRPRVSSTIVDQQATMARYEHLPEESRYAIPDMNCRDSPITGHHSPNANQEDCTNPASKHYGDPRNQYLLPELGINNLGVIPSSNVTAQSMHVDGQDKQQFADHQIRPEGTGVPANNSVDGRAPTRNSDAAAGGMHAFVDEPFYVEPDRFVGNSFDGQPSDYIGINSPNF